MKKGDEKRVTFRRFAQRIRVPAGFVLAPLLFISARPTAATLAAGAFVAVIGLAIRAWASGHVRKNEELATSGPYAHTRNPLYLGTFLLGVGVAVGGGALWFVALFAVFYLMIYVPVMLAEAETMRSLFPADYEEYGKQVPLFAPRFTPYRARSTRSNSGRQFDVSLYLQHREYRAAFGFLAVYALLAAKLAMAVG
ncbi:MAG TPA: isoprenylcysteine carboxylmethyltransferase family protein [Blastocatellia bacterium]|nr:isoprenylcysteine carboxylmethyltransferase family protein [Blastocatellia bacterium]